ncbi:hypothetical protein HK101_001371, partial [Irineochytrium annulatum]
MRIILPAPPPNHPPKLLSCRPVDLGSRGPALQESHAANAPTVQAVQAVTGLQSADTVNAGAAASVPPAVLWAGKYPNNKNFTALDTTRLLDIVGSILPAGANESVKSLKARFGKALKTKESGASKHLLLEHIQQAQAINERLMKRSESNKRRLPSADDEWVAVAVRYNAAMESEDDHRTATFLQQLFTMWKNTKKPTGDPACPEHIRRAKRAAAAIDVRVAANDSDFEPETDTEEDADDFGRRVDRAWRDDEDCVGEQARGA